MSFLSQGDYMFPFEAGFYWVKHFYIWSFQTGAPNPDGIIRFPGRLLNFIVFELFGNLGISYFYLFISLAVIFAAFYIFAKYFLNIRQKSIRIIGASFFAFNPVFLGYLAKVGLLVGVAMLPLCFVVLKKAFETRQYRYFILYILFLNISLIHPFNFTVNLVVSGIYALYLFRKHGDFIKKQWAKTLGIVLIGIALYAYFILPLAALGSVSRPEALSEELGGGGGDYTTLVDFANARNPLIALSLSRDVFLDFRYYNGAYQPVYMVAAFVFYLVLFGLYLYNEKRLNRRERQMFVVLISAFIVLLILSIATFFDINRLIKLIISLPGGWMFRSPLKWQLYIPFVLGAMICVMLARTTVPKIRKGASIIVVMTLVVMSAFLTFDIFRLLLKPRQFEQMKAMSTLDLNQKNMLFINNDDCFKFLQENLRLVGEFNQIMISNNVQLKRIKSAHAGSVNLGAYDYIFGCGSALAHPLRHETQFEKTASFADGVLELHENTSPRPYIYATDTVLALENTQNLNDKQTFANDILAKSFDFMNAKDTPGLPAVGLQDPLENLKPENILDDRIRTKLWPLEGHRHELTILPRETPLFYQQEPGRLTLSSRPEPGLSRADRAALPVEFDPDSGLDFVYLDDDLDSQNLIPNPSLEQGLWQDSVWNCYAYDNQPRIDMKLHEQEAADGRRSLQLTGERHIACTGPPEIPVTDDNQYLMSFQYKSPGGNAAYRISFDDNRGTVLSDRLPASGEDWSQFAKEIEVPEGATKLRLIVQAAPSNATESVLYDDFSLTNIPDILGRFYVTSEGPPLQKPSEASVTHVNPTKKIVQVRGTHGGFYLAMRDSYHDSWQASVSGHPLNPMTHMKLNGFMNGWYIDAGQICDQIACHQNDDGSYDLELTLEFTPQRSFYRGLAISGVTALGIVGYFGIMWRRKGRERT